MNCRSKSRLQYGELSTIVLCLSISVDTVCSTSFVDVETGKSDRLGPELPIPSQHNVFL